MIPSRRWSAVVALCLLPCLQAARVLVVFQVGAPSHWRLGRAVAMGLHARGHHITAVTPFPGQGPPENWTDVPLPDTMHLFGHSKGLFEFGKLNDFLTFTLLTNFGVSSCEIFLQNEHVQRLFQSDEQFDVMVVELFFGECFLPLAHKFRVPIVGFSTMFPMLWMSDIVGSPSPLAYVPDTLQPYSDHMSLLQRLHNVAFGTFCRVYRRVLYLPRLEALLSRHINTSGLPSLSDIEANTALILTNTHVSMFYPRPKTPNVIDVGGMHIGPPKKLPQDLQDLLDQAKYGAVLFSLGSNLRSSDMPDEKREQLLNGFSKLKQLVLWKWEDDSLREKPENVKIAKWLPQSDILAHQNLRLFITHGGLLSLTEAVHHGVPVIAVPFFGDQEFNVVHAERLGYCLRLDFDNITAESLVWAVNEVLSNPSYRRNAAEVSRRFHDRPHSGMEELVYWTEYVVRHGGAPHLRSAAMHLSWYQLLLLDVALVVLVTAACALCLLAVAVRKAVRWVSAAGVHVTSLMGRANKLKKT